MWQAAAAEFVQWFMDTSCEDCTRSMTAAHPGHFLIQVLPDGKQEVIEPTGGSPLPTRLLVDHDDTSTLAAPPAPGTDARAAGVALSGKSVPIGGVRHEFRDVPGDFRARLCVEFPKTTLPRSLWVPTTLSPVLGCGFGVTM
ncbi:hypothetical protein ABT124_38990 [Streptomyces sp. NPDC001982]|uniref:hypothetical protein n=1 Tax=Streptomyces sp. NPDC001982 TaxID=3154405 RepID=UPI00332283FB